MAKIPAAAVLLLALAFAASASTPLTACAPISQPGSYALAGNVTASTGACFNVTADDVDLDCAGHRVSFIRMGVYAFGRTGVSVRNCSFLLSGSTQPDRYGVFFNRTGSSSVTASSIDMGGYAGTGVYVEQGVRNNFSENVISSESGGINSYHSNDSEFSRNIFQGGTFGIWLGASFRNNVTSNVFRGAGYYGFGVSSTRETGEFANNFFQGNQNAILLGYGAVLTAANTTFSGNGNDAVVTSAQLTIVNYSSDSQLKYTLDGSSPTIYVDWIALLNFSRADGSPAAGTVRAYDKNGALAGTSQTDAAGAAAFVLREKKITRGSPPRYYTPHRLSFNGSGYAQDFDASVNHSGYYAFSVGNAAQGTPTPTPPPNTTPTPPANPTPTPSPTGSPGHTCSQLGGHPCSYENESCPGNRWLDASDYASCCQAECVPAGTPSPSGSFCADGTASGNCSDLAPFYCNSGQLVESCPECGCPASLQCNPGSGSCEATSTPRPTVTFRAMPTEDPQERLRRLRETGQNTSEEEELLRQYEELKRKGREKEANSVLASFNRLVVSSLSRVAGGRSGWLSLLGFLAVLALVIGALFYSSSIKSAIADVTRQPHEKPSPPPEPDFGRDEALKKRIAELRRKLGR